MEDKVQSFKEKISGRFISAKLVLDVINRVSDLVLVTDDDREVIIQNQMVDLDANSETGELQIDPKERNQGKEVTVRFDFAKRGLLLAHLWAIETEELGRIVSGIALRDESGSLVEIFAAAEVCCLFIQLPGLQSKSEPEYELAEYIKV